MLDFSTILLSRLEWFMEYAGKIQDLLKLPCHFILIYMITQFSSESFTIISRSVMKIRNTKLVL
jgi:hypothetical protein